MESCMPLNRLKQVSLLQNTNEKVLMEISKYLKLGKYTKNEIIIQGKEPLEKMIFIVEGLVIVEMRNCSSSLQLSAEEAYGEKLLTWPAWTSFPSVLPIATESLRVDGDVEVLVLTAHDIKDVVLKLKLHFFSEEITRCTDDEWELLESDRVTMLRKVSKLKTMDKQVLKAIFENLKPMTSEGNTSIITEGKPLSMMVFVTRGSLSLNKDGDLAIEHEGELYGEELLDWVLDRSFPVIVPISTHGVWVDNADILVLTAKDLGGVVSNLTWLKKGLFLGSIGAANNEEELKKLNVMHILTVANSLPPKYPIGNP